MNITFYLLAVAVGTLLVSRDCSPAEDWAEYRGNDGTGISRERISTSWPNEGPRRLWTTATPAGFSSIVVAGGKAFTVVSRESGGGWAEVCVALDTTSGKEIWGAVTGEAKYRGGGDSGAPSNSGGDGPRSTPAVSANRVYVYSAQMVLSCMDAETGKLVWKKDILHDFSGKNI